MRIITALISILFVVCLLSCSSTQKKRTVYTSSTNTNFRIANAYRKGINRKKDLSMAIYYYNLAAEEGVYEASYNLGVMYRKGEGVPKDLQKAHYYFTIAADEGGLASAQYNLGLMYYKGDGVPVDHEKARDYFVKAANQGHQRAREWSTK